MLEQLLAAWIGHQRWFGGKGRPIDSVSIDADVELEPGLRHLILAVWQDGSRDRYQLLLGERDELPERLKHSLIGVHHDQYVYDAVHDSARTGWLLRGMATESARNGLRPRHVPGVEIDTSPRSLVLGAEQSNTSLVYGDAYICKLFRRLIPGMNPELEVVTALAARKAAHIAQPYGWIETELDGTPTTLAIMQEFLSTANDGWDLALASVRDLYGTRPEQAAAEAGGDFAAESHRLGTATAHVHIELAEAFPTDVVEPPEIKRMGESFRRRLGRAVAEVPELREHADTVERAFLRVDELATDVKVQRVHGDYHLGQVMRTPTDWIVLDFEGEPGQPLAERRALSSPLRDVAGMLRSFDYAARHLLAGHPDAADLEPEAADWAARNRAAFLEGYREGGGELGPQDAVLLHAFELAKAVYEVVYEARNRPAWLPIPMAAFR
ncbi:aminoglycoside phosphotransferase [Nonomuraea sp. NBC_01738]|uniref:maltokinase N-terminal cap-like domain-containing protein n=1 Tax=Nonomuraea sp. NBC_01738 TaxID=2976003 RepID=UPI002E10686B|nr:aminoglycoside phosphotransferase [Nonomuraea sp. NBC_01738]